MDGTERWGTLVRAARRAGAFALAAVLSLVPELATGQHPPPTIPGGTPVAVLPVQAARPAPSGAWPGGSRSLDRTLEAANAELAFAFRELRGAEGWVLPDDAIERVRRNPLLKVDPERLAYRLLLEPPEDGRLIDPVHGQLRSLAALFGTRVVIVPVVVSYRTAETPKKEGEGDEEADREAEEGAAVAAPAGEDSPPGRGVLLVAVVDARAGRLLWHGEIEGELAPPESPALLATLASEVAGALTP